MNKALIFNIQKFSVHDGPGIRTTIFFKGCPLTCQWCHNPESQSYQKEILIDTDRCSQCGQCQGHCSQQAIQRINGKVLYDKSKCSYCEECMDYCYNNAREIAGRGYTVPELMLEIQQDKAFYEQSGGGVTLSGGEVMTQIDFVEELVRACKEQGISVVIDTCGYAPRENFQRIMEYVDLFLYDIKTIEPKEHRHYMGKDNVLILDNLKFLSQEGANIQLRLPLIEGINATNEHIQMIINFISDLTIPSISLLPYHHMGKDKYKKIQMEYPIENFSRPSEERLQEIQTMFIQKNYQVKIGG